MKKNSRVLFIDIARGISILLMIVGHVLGSGIKRSIIFSFHMPLFIIVSGYFYKEKPIKEEIKNLLLHLLIPSTIILFIVINIIYIPLVGFSNSIIMSLKSIIVCWSYQSKIIYNCPGACVLWFIYLLVVMKLLFIITKKISKNNDILLGCLILFETCIGCILGIKGYWLPWSIDVAFACMIFYYFGYLLKKYDLLNKILSNRYIIIILLLMWIIGIKYNWIELATRSYPNGLWCFVTAICGSLIILKISTLIEKYLKLSSKALSWCGKYSLYILIVHYFETVLIKYDFIKYNPTVTMILLIIIKCAISIIFTFIVVKIINLYNRKVKRLE